MKSAIILIITLLFFRFAEAQTNDAILFVYREPGYSEPSYQGSHLPHSTLAICVGKLVQPNDAMTDPYNGSAILTDPRTYNWLREYILNSGYVYTAKEYEKARKSGKPICPLETALEIKDSGGMDVFLCQKDWRAFFDTLRSGLQLHQLDNIVTDAFKSAPSWPRTPTVTRKWKTGDLILPTRFVHVMQEALNQDDLIAATKFIYRNRYNLFNDSLVTVAAFVIGVAKHVQQNERFFDAEFGSITLTDTATYSMLRDYFLSSSYTYRAKDAQTSKTPGKSACPLETSIEIKDFEGMDVFVCRDDWANFVDTLHSLLGSHSLLDEATLERLKSPQYWQMIANPVSAGQRHN